MARQKLASVWDDAGGIWHNETESTSLGGCTAVAQRVGIMLLNAVLEFDRGLG